MLKNLNLRMKLLTLVFSIVVIFSLLIGTYLIPSSLNSIDERTEDKLENLVDIPYSILEWHYQEYISGRMSEEEAKNKAMESIRALRFSVNDYFWLKDYQGNMLMHPFSASLEGQNLMTLEDTNGLKFIKEMVEIVNKNEKGSMTYWWNKPGKEEPQPKLSFVKGFKPWNLIIGAGIYVDDIQEVKNEFLMRVVIISSIIIALSLIITVVFSKKLTTSIIALTNIAKKVSEGDWDMDISSSSNDEIGNLTDAFKHIVDTINITMAHIHEVNHKIQLGNLNSLIDDSSLQGGWNELISSVNSLAKTLEGHMRNVPALMFTIDKDYNILYMNNATLKLLGITLEEAQRKRCYELFKTEHCQTDNCGCNKATKTGENKLDETVCFINGTRYDISYEAIPIKDTEGKIVGAFEMITDQTAVKSSERLQREQMEHEKQRALIQSEISSYQQNEVESLIKQLKVISGGKLSITRDIKPPSDNTNEVYKDFSQIYDHLENTVDNIKSYIDEISLTLGEMSQKNMILSIERDYLGDFNEIKLSINNIIDVFNDVLNEINSSAKEVSVGSEHVAQSAQDISQGAYQQSQSVDEINDSMSKIAKQTSITAENASKANHLSAMIQKDASNGNSQMDEMVKAMKEISVTSSGIANIIKVIDEIAFQTNLLALNAAVEAARAGEHGKGFAIVADEVRNLAGRTSTAAKETEQLIANSLSKVKMGSEIAESTSKALQNIVSGISDAASIISEIASLTNEQASAITQINGELNQIASVTQRNSATSEEGAAASEEMASQAEVLVSLVNEFKLKH